MKIIVFISRTLDLKKTALLCLSPLTFRNINDIGQKNWKANMEPWLEQPL